MSDIFITYARSDKARARMLADVLEQQGWSVWWDPKIPPGRSFDETIEEALDSAKCVIVLWSRNSVASDWVKTEAAEGKQRGILVPVLIDDVKIPLEFRRIQAAPLTDWQGTSNAPELDLLLKAVKRILASPISPPPVTPDDIERLNLELGATFAKSMEHWKRLEIVEARELLNHIHKIDPSYKHPGWSVNVDQLLREKRPDWRKSILIVVGHGNLAQIHDGEDAVRLKNEINRVGNQARMEFACVITDIGLLAEEQFLKCPLIAIGGPVTNKLTADICELLPHDPVGTETVNVQHALARGGRQVALWGQLAHETTQAVDLFISSGLLGRFLDLVWKKQPELR